MNALTLVKNLKEHGEDFEWYPSTPEIIRAVDAHISPNCSILDVGAGRGDVLAGLKKPAKKYAIEKSLTLVNLLPKDVYVLGTDFRRQTLVDKQVDVIFSNPPFSEFESWAGRIIKEANAESVFLVLPERWKESAEIKAALISRGDRRASVVGSYSFADAERKARGIVNLVLVTLPGKYYSNDKEGKDPFKVWFDEQFPENKTKQSEEATEQGQEARFEVVDGSNLIERLEGLYLEELAGLVDSFKKISGIPSDLLKEVGVERKAVMESLHSKIKGLKNRYWSELFKNLEQITDRLTAKSRKAMLRTLTDHTAVDFTADNAYAVVLWAIKNANGYTDEQIKELYLDLSNEETATAYKSNRHFNGKGFRYGWRAEGTQKPTHYQLDYRIVYAHSNAFGGYDWERRKHGGVSEYAADKINDLCTVAETLGFSVVERCSFFEWVAGQENVFTLATGAEFMRVRAYKNGNLHFKINKEFMLAFNVEAARLLGWIRNQAQAAEEMSQPVKSVEKAWNKKTNIELSTVGLLCNG